MSTDRIKVVARIRPLSAKEAAIDEEIVTHVSDNNADICVQSSSAISTRKTYRCDYILNETCSQQNVFSFVVPLLENVFEGINCSLFTYGQTGTGKTHTMLGYDLWSMAQKSGSSEKYPMLSSEHSEMGIIPRSMKYLFDKIAHLPSSRFRVSISYIEIYNEKIVDLLNFDADARDRLEIRENKKGEILVPGLVDIEVADISQVFDVLWTGAQVRSVAANDMNDYSSRSHTIFQVRVEQQSLVNNAYKVAKLCLIDLAGSEKWRSHQLAKFSQDRIKELTSINKSLSALGNCISALMRPEGRHIPYRDSKLTRLLQDSLKGNTKILFIVTISPSVGCMEETVSTLQFADRAMKVQIFARPNVVELDTDKSIEHYKQEVVNLKSIIQTLMNAARKQHNGASAGPAQLLSSPSSGSSGGDGGSGSNVEGMIAEDLHVLRAENFSLTQKLAHALADVTFYKEELVKLTDIVYGDGGLAQWRREQELLKEEEGEEYDGPMAGIQEAQKQRAYIASLTDGYEERSQAVLETEQAQEERWQSLLSYHSWLQSQTQVLVAADQKQLQLQQETQHQPQQGGGMSSGTAVTNNGTVVDKKKGPHAPMPSSSSSSSSVHTHRPPPAPPTGGNSTAADAMLQRVLLLETSVLRQTEELHRAKSTFLKVRMYAHFDGGNVSYIEEFMYTSLHRLLFGCS